MEWRQFGLLITDRCTAECSFCGLACEKQHGDVIDESFAKEVIRQAWECGVRDRFAITGGEALLYPDLCGHLLDYAKELGFTRRTIATNAFWGAWDDSRIDEVLDKLGACTWVSISYDAFHAEYIPQESVWKAIRFMERHKIPGGISIADVEGEKGAGPFVASLDDDILNKKLDIYPLLAVGRAENMPDDLFIREQPLEQATCFNSDGFAVDPRGRVYPCCSPAVFRTGFSLGDLHEQPLSKILTSSPGLQLMHLMEAPRWFYKLALFARDELGVDVPDMVGNGCEICYRIAKDPDFLQKIQPAIDKCRQEIFLENLMKRGDAS